MAVLKVLGPDAKSFVARQASNKLPGFAAFLLPNGQIVSLTYINELDDGYAIFTENAEKLKSHLEKFTITEDLNFQLAEGKTEAKLESFNEGDTLIKLDLIDKYVSFDKGCFPGQEVLAKYKHIGLRKKEERSSRYTDEALKLFAAGDNAAAKELLEKALKENPKNEDALETLGVIYGREGDYQRAIQIMQQLEMLNPESIMAKTNLSIFYMKIGDKEKAEEYKAHSTVAQFEQALKDA